MGASSKKKAVPQLSWPTKNGARVARREAMGYAPIPPKKKENTNAAPAKKATPKKPATALKAATKKATTAAKTRKVTKSSSNHKLI